MNTKFKISNLISGIVQDRAEDDNEWDGSCLDDNLLELFATINDPFWIDVCKLLSAHGNISMDKKYNALDFVPVNPNKWIMHPHWKHNNESAAKAGLQDWGGDTEIAFFSFTAVSLEQATVNALLHLSAREQHFWLEFPLPTLDTIYKNMSWTECFQELCHFCEVPKMAYSGTKVGNTKIIRLKCNGNEFITLVEMYPTVYYLIDNRTS